MFDWKTRVTIIHLVMLSENQRIKELKILLEYDSFTLATLNSTNDITLLDTIHLVTWLSSLDIKVIVFLYVRLTGMYHVDRQWYHKRRISKIIIF